MRPRPTQGCSASEEEDKLQHPYYSTFSLLPLYTLSIYIPPTKFTGAHPTHLLLLHNLYILLYTLSASFTLKMAAEIMEHFNTRCCCYDLKTKSYTFHTPV
jgi:hypothetical protein